MTTRSSRPGIVAVSAHEVRFDDSFRNLLADALIARHRAQITDHPELMFMRATWDANGWARAEADELLAHIRAVLEHQGAPRSAGRD